MFAIIFKRVLFPLPFSPMIPRASPSSTIKLISVRAWKVSYVGGLKAPVKVSKIVVLFFDGVCEMSYANAQL